MPNSVHNSFMRRKSLAAWYIHAAHNCEKKRERNSLKCAELFQKKKKRKSLQVSQENGFLSALHVSVCLGE